ncbi:MAG TPA: ribonuclease P protein component [Burkholderiaceae bacterium]
MIGRLVQAADFQRLLAAPSLQRSAHFSVHYVCGVPVRPGVPLNQAGPNELSTGHEPTCPRPVDEAPAGRWLGCVVPKRHARRSVTRSMLKRQIRAAAERHHERLARGLWLVRLRSPFVVAQFPSADSAALRSAARSELDRLLVQATR